MGVIVFRTCQIRFMGNCNRVGSVVNGRKAVPKKTDLWRVRTGAAGGRNHFNRACLVSIFAYLASSRF